MDFEAPLFLTPFLAGAVIVIMGFVTLNFPPKPRNFFYGYKTPGSMKSKERWDFAQRYGAKQMLKAGLILGIFSFPGWFFQPAKGISFLLGTGEVILVVVVTIARVELALKKRFGD